MPIKVFIADDHQAIIDGFKNLLAHEEDLSFGGEALNASELKQRINNNIDVLLLDVFDEEPEFLCLIKELSSKYPLLKILILSGRENLLFAQKTIECGAKGYISKVLRSKDIYNTVREVHKFPSMTILKLPNSDPVDDEGMEVKDLLTPRQLQVISLLCKGFRNNEEIAEFLGKINKKTIKAGAVQSHRRDIRARLRDYGITNDTSLGYWTAKWNLLDGNELSSTA